jgi:MoaA/NifB/PqqE/SkfB family radical SAM enzyme
MKSKEFPNIDPVFTDHFPENYRPWVPSWSVKEEALHETLPDGTHTLTQLDISIPSGEFAKKVNAVLDADERNNEWKRNYQELACGVGCKHCFECRTQNINPLMTTEEIFGMLKEAKELGLKNVKFLGPGELLHNPDLFRILDFLRDNEINIGIFTKGVALGDDTFAQKTFGLTSKELCEKLSGYENVSVLISLTSTDRKTEKQRNESTKFPDLFDIRNKAFENCSQAGLNKDPENQRLAVIIAPVLKDNIDEVAEIYEWAVHRNMPVVVAPTMISGKGLDMPEVTDSRFKNEELVNLYVDIYTMLINKKILSIAQVEKEGVSPYAGYACNQFVSGMFVRADGRVQGCPGNEAFGYSDDVRKEGVKKVWKNSLGHSLRDELMKNGELSLTQPCYAKSEELVSVDGQPAVEKGCGSIPCGFYKKVMNGIKKPSK